MGAMPAPDHATSSSQGSAPWLAWLVAGLAGVAVAIAIVAMLNGPLAGASAQEPASSPSPSEEPSSLPSPSPSPTPTVEEPPPTVNFTFAAAGDILTHAPVNTSASSGGAFDYSPLMANLQPYIEGADIAICHLEVPVAPPGSAPSGYPMFGAPAEIVRDLDEAGWDGCSTASNHSVDRKFAGVVATIDQFDAYRMGFAGTARSEAEAAKVQMYHVREGSRVIKVANISYAYGLNGLPIPPEAPWSVNTFNADATDVSPILAAAQQARDQGADVVIASIHCCVEYRTEPTPAQRSVVEQIAASGLVDLYVGHHAHVPQPIERLAGGPNGDGMWAAFGLGNYLSNQDTQCCVAQTNSGVLLVATFSVDPDNRVDVGVEWTGTTVDRLGKHTMYVLSDVPGGAGKLSAAEIAARSGRVAAAVGGQAPQRTTPAQPLADAAYFVERIPWTPGG